MNIKYAAKLKFLADESFDEGSHIDTLLRAPKVAQDLEPEPMSRTTELAQHQRARATPVAMRTMFRC